ncbi:MAG: hypothetical protein FJX77_14745 [Armatimonadetes bacterium]|nr:hypothetical protein [Armatimonadota bacterium]
MMKSVTVRLILVRLAGATVEEIPPDAPRLFDNTITCDFLPKHSARGILQFRIPDPGSYRLRLESEGTRPEHDHDHFSAMDVLVE